MYEDLTLEAVHRDEDGEVVGYLSFETRDHVQVWVARSIFGGELKGFAERADAARFLGTYGLSILAEKWRYWSESEQRWLLTHLVEARLGSVQVRFGYDPSAKGSSTLAGAELANLKPTRLH